MDNFVIKDINGKKALFATRSFGKNEVLFNFEGETTNIGTDASLQIGHKLYLNIDKHYGQFSLHNCNPNTYIKIAMGSAFLVSLLPITNGDEITFDYSLTSTDTLDTWSMPCNCSQFYCRKVISGFSSLPEDKKARYIEMGIVPKYNV
jgi:hypothetical protein